MLTAAFGAAIPIHILSAVGGRGYGSGERKGAAKREEGYNDETDSDRCGCGIDRACVQHDDVWPGRAARASDAARSHGEGRGDEGAGRKADREDEGTG